MHTVYALVDNFESDSGDLQFSDFRLKHLVRGDTDELQRAKQVFDTCDVTYGKWVYSRTYGDTHMGGTGFGSIPFDTEDTLLLMRLFKVGDICFSCQIVIEEPGGRRSRQMPYRIMAEVPSTIHYRLQVDQCSQFDSFARDHYSCPAWRSTWFRTARRFFLYGGGKEFNTHWNEVDRILDYMIALEAILVPEHDFVGRRLRERAVRLLDVSGPEGDRLRILCVISTALDRQLHTEVNCQMNSGRA